MSFKVKTLGVLVLFHLSITIKAIPYTINVMAITIGVWRCASIKSSNKIVTTAPGMQATTTLNHIEKISFSITGLLLSLNWNGNILFQNKTTTARIAPNWITTKNISLKSALTFILINSSTKSICPVLLIGSHSVIPSTIPKKITLIISIKSNILYPLL